MQHSFDNQPQSAPHGSHDLSLGADFFPSDVTLFDPFRE
jgi:hypothetical protein